MRNSSITNICPVCKKQFHPKPSEVNRGKGLFCSRICCDIGRAETLEERFWRHVRRTEYCWEWMGLKNRNGYGRTWTSGKASKEIPAHRVSWIVHFGDLSDDLFVCHHCDNPGCVNPEHLFLGTPADNMADKVKKGRQARIGPKHPAKGEQNAMAKLNNEDVRYALNLRNSGMSQEKIGRTIGVSQTTIHRIFSGQSWKHVGREST